MTKASQAKWFRLDNAALIFPAVMKRGWSNVFRLSCELDAPLDPEILRQAVNNLYDRFPTFYVRLKGGFFWHYLEQMRSSPVIQEDYAYPLTPMGIKAIRQGCFRVLYYQNRLAVEFFHSVTDGSGGLVYLKNLVARYLHLKESLTIPHTHGILSLDEKPSKKELEDCFPLCSGNYPYSRKEATSYRLSGTHEFPRFHHLISGTVSTEKLKKLAKDHGVSITAFLAAVMLQALIQKQAEEQPFHKHKPVKITIPVNLRRLFHKTTLRNFSLTLNLGVDPRFGDHSLKELCFQMQHQLLLEVVPQKMAARIATNVGAQKNPLLRSVPRIIKTAAMRYVYGRIGERKGTINLSNLGQVEVPDEMLPYIKKIEFVISPQYSYPNNCSVISFNGQTSIHFIRNVKESDLERRFFASLVSLNLPVFIQSNERN